MTVPKGREMGVGEWGEVQIRSEGLEVEPLGAFCFCLGILGSVV